MTLEGWVPQVGDYLTLAEVIDFAFDYRGNTTIVKTDGTEVVGYVFNRDNRVPEPFIQFFDEKGEGPFTLPYSAIGTITFTGKDTAAGNSWKAWLEHKEREKAKTAGALGGEGGAPDPGPHRG
jgi:hypothetical protein